MFKQGNKKSDKFQPSFYIFQGPVAQKLLIHYWPTISADSDGAMWDALIEFS